MLWFVRFNRWGRCRVVVGMSGEAGSFLTTILGAGPRDLRDEGRLEAWRVGGDMDEVNEAVEVAEVAEVAEVTEVAEVAEGARQEDEEREERLKDVRKR